MSERNQPAEWDPSDPSMREVHDLKRRASERCGHDLRRIAEEIRRIQDARPQGQLVRRADEARRGDAA